MTPKDSVQIFLSDQDFRDLVDEALTSDVIQNYGYSLKVTEVTTLSDDDTDGWAITFTQKKKS